MYPFANTRTNSFFHLRTVCSLLLLMAGAASACISTPVGRDISVVSARWKPDSVPLTVVDNLNLLTEEEETTLLNDPALHGQIHVTRCSSTGRGTGSRTILILQQPVQETVYLAVPGDATVIYIQEQDRWRMIPEDAPLLDDFRFRLETVKEGEIYATGATLELPRGGSTLLGGVGWTEE